MKPSPLAAREPTDPDSAAASRYVHTGGARIHYAVRGDAAAEPLVVLHGNGEDHTTLEAQIAAFSEQFRVIALDTRGHGRSVAGSEPWDFPLLARDVCAVLDAEGARSARFFGYSDGGNIILQMLLDHPQRVRSAVVVGANLDPAGLHPWARASMVVQKMLLGVVSRRLPCVRRSVRRLALMTDHPRIDPVRLRRAEVPVLVMAGEHDIVRAGHTALIARSLPASELHIMAGAGHDIPMARAAECAQRSLAFLRAA
ncbi:alpha/beta fold hydrolase [Hoyosella sp. G463]|uniref:Alpha/beta fold hydrolase n=1 Tax=Lolliginicoccus lacisalsi TaxID=2742202 RepID=A0A927PKQ4_9ACTN|nr:alpha/beta fold hydrolase [Lolliginicoccus lacisalsi]MBD8505983.1 alpha/beta fold hydrolase [Lolliginicoccus lacisalsi]